MAAASGLLAAPSGLGVRRHHHLGGGGGGSNGLPSSSLYSSGGSSLRMGRCGSGRQGTTPRRRRCAAAPHAVLVPASIVGAAARMAAAVPAALAGVIDPAVLSATVNASGKLFLICAAVGWLLRTGR